MPRQPRLDAPGLLQHVMARGIERRKIFLDDKDRTSFLERFAVILDETQTQCYAWALIPNHFHLLLRKTPIPLPRSLTVNVSVLNFSYFYFKFVSYFDIRISDLTHIRISDWVWLFCIFDMTIAVVAILFIRLVRAYLIILRWPVFLAYDFEFVVTGTEPSA